MCNKAVHQCSTLNLNFYCMNARKIVDEKGQSQSKATGKPSKKQAASALSKLLAPSDAKVGGVSKLITLLERAEEPDESVRALLRKVLEVDLKEVTDSECEESCTKSLARAERKYRRFVKKHNRFLYAPLAAAMPAEDERVGSISRPTT
jgi:hypothetical protein